MQPDRRHPYLMQLHDEEPKVENNPAISLLNLPTLGFAAKNSLTLYSVPFTDILSSAEFYRNLTSYQLFIQIDYQNINTKTIMLVGLML